MNIFSSKNPIIHTLNKGKLLNVGWLCVTIMEIVKFVDYFRS